MPALHQGNADATTTLYTLLRGYNRDSNTAGTDVLNASGPPEDGPLRIGTSR
jgi:hypothetical protein